MPNLYRRRSASTARGCRVRIGINVVLARAVMARRQALEVFLDEQRQSVRFVHCLLGNY
jgi:hypothetical protein